MATAKSEQIITELLDYSVQIVRYVQVSTLPRSVQDQLIRSATSIGANFSEAQDACSKKDFLNKIYIAKKEASETKYWLQLAQRLQEENEETKQLIADTQKYIMILQKIVNTVKTGDGKS